MKKLLTAMFVALLMVGCGENTKKPGGDSSQSNQSTADNPPAAKTAEVAKVVVDGDKIEEREDLYYFEGKLFTGLAVDKYENGQKKYEATLKDGKEHGLWTEWYENGQKEEERTYKDGKLHGLTRWHENGQKKNEVIHRIAFIIDYSASMRGRDLVMRAELEAAVNKIPPVDSLPDKEVYNRVCLIFFSGPTWLAGENANALHKNWEGTNGAGWSPKAGFTPSRPKWIPVTRSTKKNLSKAIWHTPLTFGSAWDNSFRCALTKLDPKPDVIYFMTNGFVGVAEGRKCMEVIKNHRGSTKINTIGYGTPYFAKIPLQEIADMTGGKSKFFSMDQIRNMEKKIKK
jgi:hypothetical protein